MPQTGEDCLAAGTFRCASCGEIVDLGQNVAFPDCPNEDAAVTWEEVPLTVGNQRSAPRGWQGKDSDQGRPTI